LNAEQARAFWFGRINYEQRSPKPSDLKLERMDQLLAYLGNPHRDLRIIHVAGSKGKGSTSAMLASILRRSGYSIGLFTSPHLSQVEERINVDDQPISAEELTLLLNEVQPAVAAMEKYHGDKGSVTFFEVATALGFLHFARRRVDLAVIEVGLGGRFDSTNVCMPLVSLITSISFDHTGVLGHRLTQIAIEKAGIIKPGRPAVSGARDRDASREIERICRERSAPLRRVGDEIRYRYEPGQITRQGVRLPRVWIETDRRAWPEMSIGLLGDHQASNAAVAVGALEHVCDAGFRIEDRAVAEGLAGVQWPARLEILGRRPMIVLDCAHNVASVQALVDTLATSFPNVESNGELHCIPRRRLLVFGSSNDKDLAGMLRVLASAFDYLFLTRYASNSRSVAPDQLAGILRCVANVPFSTHGNSAEAWKAARCHAQPEDLICITGSVFLAGELRPLLDPVGFGHPGPALSRPQSP
jgi:dihydrofolate synthase/folylpolyglutamate synthase